MTVHDQGSYQIAYLVITHNITFNVISLYQPYLKFTFVFVFIKLGQILMHLNLYSTVDLFTSSLLFHYNVFPYSYPYYKVISIFMSVPNFYHLLNFFHLHRFIYSLYFFRIWVLQFLFAIQTL